MPVEQLREDLRLHLALAQLVVALLVLRVVLRLRINRGEEHDVLSVRRPDPAVRSRGNVRHLMRLAVEPAALRSKVGHPDLGRVGRFRSPDQALAVRRKPRALFVVRRLIQPARVPACRGHDPEMRDFCVRIQIDVDRVEHDPFSIRRRHRRADPFQFHHVLERERVLRGRARIRRWGLGGRRNRDRETKSQDFPMHRCVSAECANSRRTRRHANGGEYGFALYFPARMIRIPAHFC